MESSSYRGFVSDSITIHSLSILTTMNVACKALVEVYKSVFDHRIRAASSNQLEF